MPNCLMDTNALLWLLWNDPRLGPAARAFIADPGNRKFVSPVSIYEIAYKYAQGRLEKPVPGNLEVAISGRGFHVLRLNALHAERAGRMDYSNSDPHDRMLVVQALTEGLILITADRDMLRHEVPTLNARR